MTQPCFNRVLAALALSFAALMPVYASQVITFDNGLDTGAAPFAPLLTHGDALVQGDYVIGTVSTESGAQAGDFVGALIDGSDVANICAGIVCPNNNASTFLAMLNDGLPYVQRLDGLGFQIKSFDASFIAAEDDVVPSISLVLRVYGFAADNSASYEDVLLPGPDSHGAYSFSSYSFSDSFSSRSFVEVDFYGYACDAEGTCSRRTNRAQFTLDNIVLSEAATVPEPSSLALLGLAIAGLGFVHRRRIVVTA